MSFEVAIYRLGTIFNLPVFLSEKRILVKKITRITKKNTVLGLDSNNRSNLFERFVDN